MDDPQAPMGDRTTDHPMAAAMVLISMLDLVGRLTPNGELPTLVLVVIIIARVSASYNGF